MRTTKLQMIAASMALLALSWSAPNALAQDSSVASPASIGPGAPGPQLNDAARQILQLAQAKVGDETIMAFVKNSRSSFALNADQIIYLRQQGISDAVIMTMLSQPRPAPVRYTPAPPASTPVSVPDYNGQVAPVAAAPAITYVQTAPAASYYYQPDYDPYYYYRQYYYPNYYWYSPASFSFGWSGGYYNGWRGGYCGGGWHGGGYSGWHGGGYGGRHGGGGYGGGHGGGFGGGGHGGGGFGGGHGGGHR